MLLHVRALCDKGLGNAPWAIWMLGVAHEQGRRPVKKLAQVRSKARVSALKDKAWVG